MMKIVADLSTCCGRSITASVLKSRFAHFMVPRKEWKHFVFTEFTEQNVKKIQNRIRLKQRCLNLVISYIS